MLEHGLNVGESGESGAESQAQIAALRRLLGFGPSTSGECDRCHSARGLYELPGPGGFEFCGLCLGREIKRQAKLLNAQELARVNADLAEGEAWERDEGW